MTPRRPRSIPIGAVLSIIGISSLVYGLIQAPDAGWGSPATITAFGIAIAVLTLFVLWELHTPEPMLDMRFFKNRAFSVGTGGMILVFLSMYGVMFLLTQYFQLVLDYSPLSAAFRLLPLAPIMIIVAPMTPRLSARFGSNRVVAAGMGCIGIGFLMFRALGVDTPYLYVLISVTPIAAGMSLAMSPMTAAIMSSVPTRRAGAGSAMNDASRELGAALGVAVLGSLAASKYSSTLNHLTSTLTPSERDSAQGSLAGALDTASKLPEVAGKALTSGAEHAFIDGFHLAVTAGAAPGPGRGRTRAAVPPPRRRARGLDVRAGWRPRGHRPAGHRRAAADLRRRAELTFGPTFRRRGAGWPEGGAARAGPPRPWRSRR